jgi:hypothetical protein
LCSATEGLQKSNKKETPVILAIQEAKIRRITNSKPVQVNSFARPYLEKPFTKIRLVKWLKVKALSSNPNTTKKKKKETCGFHRVDLSSRTF